ncbi:hypothetical protein ACGFJ7_13625 [Actinoplanes sp. NPDC048988]|uniref:hypothetical protein n=1 Tax=Actinoplanes sp. NPDC048988 TaxID=3363901 RepID=UPI003718902C
MKSVDAGVLSVAYLEDGPAGGWPVVLSHGFPYDAHAYDEVVPVLEWAFDEATFARTAPSFGNPDFVDVVVHAYRHALGRAAGDPAYEDLEARLAARPKITVPAVTLDGATDILKPGGTAGHASMFSARHEHRLVAAGHNLPQEAPAAFAEAVATVRQWS